MRGDFDEDELDDDDHGDRCSGCGADITEPHEDDCPYIDDEEEELIFGEDPNRT